MNQIPNPPREKRAVLLIVAVTLIAVSVILSCMFAIGKYIELCSRLDAQKASEKLPPPPPPPVIEPAPKLLTEPMFFDSIKQVREEFAQIKEMRDEIAQVKTQVNAIALGMDENENRRLQEPKGDPAVMEAIQQTKADVLQIKSDVSQSKTDVSQIQRQMNGITAMINADEQNAQQDRAALAEAVNGLVKVAEMQQAALQAAAKTKMPIKPATEAKKK